MKDWKVLFYNKRGPTFWELVRQVFSSTKTGYDLLADKFDYTPFRTPSEILEVLDRELSFISPVDKGLDICCGTGAAMNVLLNHCNSRVVGLDISQKMMDVAKKNLSLHSAVDNASFVQGDAFNLPYEDEFDIVTNFGGLGHITNDKTDDFLNQVHKVLKQKGMFVFVTTYHPSFLSLSFWKGHTFNLLMRFRNLIIKPKFIMYYLTFMLPKIAYHLESQGFKVELKKEIFPKPFHRHILVIATKK